MLDLPLKWVPGKPVGVGSSVQGAPGDVWASQVVNSPSVFAHTEVDGVLFSLSLLVFHFLREI